MKSLTCEMCGGTELIKQDGYYVCQNCGVKYSLEEAKKMMIEGVVKIDDSSKIDNYYSLAKTAYNSGNHEEAEKYCNKIIEIDSDYYKAWFLKGVSTGWQSSITDVHFDEAIVYFHKAMQLSPKAKVKELEEQIADEMSKMFLACYYAHCKYYGKFGTTKAADELKQAFIDILEYRTKIVRVLGPLIEMDRILYSKYMYESVKDAYYNSIKRRYGTQPSRYDLLKYIEECTGAVNLLNGLSDFLHEYINNGNDKAKSLYIKMKELQITIYREERDSYFYNSGNWKQSAYYDSDKADFNSKIDRCKSEIKSVNPSYEYTRETTPTSNGCYVATAVYGSYDCPQVWTLRRFRDYTLAETWYGRAFIHTYYAISPTLVKWFGHTEWFKKMWRGSLDRMVAKLNAKGVEDTPYEDKDW